MLERRKEMAVRVRTGVAPQARFIHHTAGEQVGLEAVGPQIGQFGESRRETLPEDQAPSAEVGRSEASQVESPVAEPVPLTEEPSKAILRS